MERQFKEEVADQDQEGGFGKWCHCMSDERKDCDSGPFDEVRKMERAAASPSEERYCGNTL